MIRASPFAALAVVAAPPGPEFCHSRGGSEPRHRGSQPSDLRPELIFACNRQTIELPALFAPALIDDLRQLKAGVALSTEDLEPVVIPAQAVGKAAGLRKTDFRSALARCAHGLFAAALSARVRLGATADREARKTQADEHSPVKDHDTMGEAP